MIPPSFSKLHLGVGPRSRSTYPTIVPQRNNCGTRSLHHASRRSAVCSRSARPPSRGSFHGLSKLQLGTGPRSKFLRSTRELAPGTRLSVSLNAFPGVPGTRSRVSLNAFPGTRLRNNKFQCLPCLAKSIFWGKHKLVVFFPPTGEYRSSRSRKM